MIVFFKSIPRVKTEIPLFIVRDVNATCGRKCIQKWHGWNREGQGADSRGGAIYYGADYGLD
jgi:hypothetical protein